MVSRTKKFRGSRTHGKGKKHGRGHGDRGGTGNAGLHKHKFKWMLIYDPDHFGAHGFNRHVPGVRPKTYVNVGDIEARLQEFASKGAAQQTEQGYRVDLSMLGIEKLLGDGRTGLPLEIIVAEASASAKGKIEAAGGKVVTTVQENEKGK